MTKQGYPGKAGLYATVMDLYRTTRALSSEEYALRDPRERAVATASRAIAKVTDGLAKGFTQFRQDWLFHPDTTYLKVSLNGRGYGSPGYDRYLTLSRIGFVVRDGETFAVDPDTGEELGVASEHSLPGRRDEPRWLYSRTHPEYRKTWLDLKLCASRGGSSQVLMLSGPLLVHKPVARMAAVASAIHAGTAPEFEPLRDVDSAIRAVAERSAAAKAEARAAVAAHPGLAQLTEAHPGLVRNLQTMDWTYEEADRPDPRSREQERQIEAGLWALGLEDATALFVSHNPIYWGYLGQYLDRHPDLKQRAA